MNQTTTKMSGLLSGIQYFNYHLMEYAKRMYEENAMKENKDMTKQPVMLADDDMDQVNGGMKIILLKGNRFLNTMLKYIFKIKKKHNDRRSNAKSDKDTD